jgi:hypothetical protein
VKIGLGFGFVFGAFEGSLADSKSLVGFVLENFVDKMSSFPRQSDFRA